MTLPAAGNSLAFSQINVELGRSGGSLMSINSASNGLYATINLYSPFSPSSLDPESVSEWYSYNHAATTTAPCYNLGTINYYPNQSLYNQCCYFTSTQQMYSNCPFLDSDCYVYTNSSCTTPVTDGWALTDFSAAYFVGANGYIGSSVGCGC